MTNNSENYYSILGVNENSSSDEIKKAYRKLSMKWHPDRNEQSEESSTKFKSISRAYDVLGDKQKKKGYDFERNNPFLNSNGGAEDIFQMFFNNGGGNLGPGIHFFSNMKNFNQSNSKPMPIIKKIIISLNQAYSGCKIPLNIERWITNNNEKRQEIETVYLSIPKGIDSNEIIILRGKGNVINETNKGDIKVFINVNNTTDFLRQGLDLVFKKTVTLKESLCGFSFNLNHINGSQYKINNKKGNVIPTNFDKIIPNMGMEREGQKGSLFIKFTVRFPETLSNEVIEKLEMIL